MESKEKENKLAKERDEVRRDTNDIRAENKKAHHESTRKINGLWIWLGVIILIFILLYWLFTIGVFDSIAGAANG